MGGARQPAAPASSSECGHRVAMEDGLADELDEEEQLVRKQRKEKKELQGEGGLGCESASSLTSPEGPVCDPHPPPLPRSLGILSSSGAPPSRPRGPLPRAPRGLSPSTPPGRARGLPAPVLPRHLPLAPVGAFGNT